MARIVPLPESEAPAPAREMLEQQRAAHGRVTNMKRTLAHSPPALRALMQWYHLHDEVRPFLGERLTTLFAHAVSTQTDCLICSTFFRRWLIEAGEDPDHLSWMNASKRWWTLAGSWPAMPTACPTTCSARCGNSCNRRRSWR